MRPKPKVFIASPLFNPQQIAIIESIERLCDQMGYSYYSARRDSEPYLPLPEDRRKPEAWDRVFHSNETGLNECTIMVAVLAYALSCDQKVALCKLDLECMDDECGIDGFAVGSHKPMELPDSGTVWEMGYFRAMKKLVVGYHPSQRGDHLNLMLTHGCDGLITGVDNLTTFFTNGSGAAQRRPVTRALHGDSARASSYFDWSACERWAAQQGGVEDGA